MSIKSKLYCSDCGKYEIPDYNEKQKGRAILIGTCSKCGCGVYKFISSRQTK